MFQLGYNAWRKINPLGTGDMSSILHGCRHTPHTDDFALLKSWRNNDMQLLRAVLFLSASKSRFQGKVCSKVVRDAPQISSICLECARPHFVAAVCPPRNYVFVP